MYACYLCDRLRLCADFEELMIPNEQVVVMCLEHEACDALYLNAQNTCSTEMLNTVSF